MNLVRIDEEYEEKMLAFEIDCNDGKGAPEACQSAAEFFSIVKNEKGKAAKLFEDNCANNNHGPSCFSLGRMYYSGDPMKKDTAKAKEMFDKGCGLKLLHSCHFLYALKWDEKKNLQTEEASKIRKESLEKLQKNCRDGCEESCLFAGKLLIAPASPDREPLKAVDMLKKACDRNDVTSCYNLSVLFKKGDGPVKPDLEQHEMYKSITETLLKQKKTQMKKSIATL